MTVRNKKRCLVALATAQLAATIGLLLWTLAPPAAPLDHHPANTPPSRPATATASPTASLSLSDFHGLLDRSFRRPLYDPPPPPPKPVKKKPPRPIRAKLLATMVEPGNSTAMLQLQSNLVVFRKVGDPIDADNADAVIAEIRPGTILVRRGQQETTLSVDKGRAN